MIQYSRRGFFTCVKKTVKLQKKTNRCPYISGIRRATILKLLFLAKRKSNVAIPRAVSGGLQSQKNDLCNRLDGTLQYRERYQEGYNQTFTLTQKSGYNVVAIPRAVSGGLQCPTQNFGKSFLSLLQYRERYQEGYNWITAMKLTAS